MKLYLLIHEQDTDAAWGCDVKTFLSLDAAKAAMRMAWEETVKAWEYNEKDHGVDDESFCGYAEAVIRDDSDVERWRIEEKELDVRVAVKVVGGMVQDAIANAGVNLDVYDLDVSDFPDDDEEEAADRRGNEYEQLSKSPGWSCVW